MAKKDFDKRLKELDKFMTVNDSPMEHVNKWHSQTLPNVFAYGATSEHCMEMQLAEVGKERITTFMSDLSIAEWCESKKGVISTCKNVLKEWRDDEKYMSEFVLCVNWKAWEHDARKNYQWSKFYSLLYDWVRDYVYDYYEGDGKKTAYVWEYLD